MAASDGTMMVTHDGTIMATRDGSMMASRDGSMMASRDGSMMATRDRLMMATRDATMMAPRDGETMAARNGKSVNMWSGMANTCKTEKTNGLCNVGINNYSGKPIQVDVVPEMAADETKHTVCNGSSPPTTQDGPANTANIKQCAACGRGISDRYLLHTMDRYWHVSCLKCSSCQVALAEIGSTCFSRAGMTLCKSDYIRLFGLTGTCSSCRLTIPANEFVMKTPGSVYHVTCFACATCHNRLVPGDRYGIVNGSLICENDYWNLMTAEVQQSQQGSIRISHKV